MMANRLSHTLNLKGNFIMSLLGCQNNNCIIIINKSITKIKLVIYYCFCVIYLSEWFVYKSGPSLNLDGSWNGLMEGLRYVQSLISCGLAEGGIVGCTSLGKLNECAFHFKQMGRLNEDGKTKCFSDDGLICYFIILFVN